MKYEYMQVISRHLIKKLREKDPRNGDGDEVLIYEELNRLGSEGWEIVPNGPDFFCKRVCGKP